MYPTSEAYKKAITSHFRDGQNAIVEFSKKKFEQRWIRSISFSHLLNDDEYLTFGSISSKKVEISLNDLDGSIKTMQLGGEYFGLTYQMGEQLVPIGTFRVDGSPDKNEKNVVKITAYDRLYYADTRYYCMLGQSYTGKDLLLDATSQAGIELASETILAYTNMDLKQTYVPENMTCRQVISYVAELTGSMAVMTRDDKLDFIQLVNNMPTAGALDIHNCYDMTFDEADYIVDGLRYYESDDSFLKAGTGKKRIICLTSANFLVNQQVLDNLINRINGMTFRPFKCPRYDGDPAIDAGDILATSNLDGSKTYRIMPTVVTWEFNGGLKGTLENPASTSATVSPKNTTTLEQKISQTYYQKAGITYAYNTEKVVLGLRESTLCDIKFANSYGNVPTGAIGISGLFTPASAGESADITLRFVSDKEELPYHPVQHVTTPGKYVVYAPLVMYMLGSGDHYFQAYASISSGSYEIEAEQFTLQVLTIGTGGGVKSPDTYLSETFRNPIEINGNLLIESFIDKGPSVSLKYPIIESLSDVINSITIGSNLSINGFIDHASTSHVILNDRVDTINFNEIVYSDRYVIINDENFVLQNKFEFVSVNQPIDQGILRVVSIDASNFKTLISIKEK